MRVVYDTGALLAGERRNQDFLALHRRLLNEGVTPTVPVVVLAQAWRGAPAHNLSRVLKACDVEPDTEDLARYAGVACRAAGTGDVVDALVVVTALNYRAAVVTSDPHDLNRLADGLDEQLRLFIV